MAIRDEDEGEEQVQTIEGAEQGEVVRVDDKADAQQANDGQDERIAQRAHDEDEGEEHEVNAATEAEREARRLERRARKEREKAAKERTRRELDFLRNRNEQLERRFSQYEQRQAGSEAAIINARISEVEKHIKDAEEVHAAAITQQKGEDATEAMRIRGQLMTKRDELLGFRQQILDSARQQQQPAQQQEQQRQQAPATPEVSEELLSHAADWMKRNPWYKANRSDEDSRIAGVIDDGLMAEGFDPDSKEYWDELSKRVAERLPNKVRQQQGARSGGPAMANGGRGTPAVRPGEIYVSPERKQALIDAGAWDDPKLRMRYLKRYQQYDNEHKASGSNRA